jgi:hypothetical protein
MFNVRKTFQTLAMALCSGLLVVGLYSPGWAKPMATVPASTIGQQIDANLEAAQAPLLSQGMATNDWVTYVAILSPREVVPNTPRSMARGAVGAVLSGDRLVVRASFRDLTSDLRDYATDPLDPPNPNITSAFHIHQGSPDENGPFQYALDVMVNEDTNGGRAMGEYTLTPEQIQALNNGMLYVDVHTTRYRGGELRGILMPM